MKKWIALITAVACAFSTSLPADGAPPAEPVTLEAEIVPQATSEESTIVEEPAAIQTEPERKSVGTAAVDGSQTASSNVGKYVLAASAIAVGIVALVMVSHNSGHHKH
jgi:hypothetical protein